MNKHNNKNLIIRQADKHDFDSIWPIVNQVINDGTTYEYPIDMSKNKAFYIWMEKPENT